MGYDRKVGATMDSVAGSPQSLARGLGVLGVGLGALELLAPRTVARALGLFGNEKLIVTYGAREIATGIGLLAAADKEPWVWTRFWGDGADLGALMAATYPRNPQKANAWAGMAMVGAIALIDFACARALRTEKIEGKRRHQAVRRGGVDYSDRTGYKRPLEQMRGIAREAAKPGAARPASRPMGAGTVGADI